MPLMSLALLAFFAFGAALVIPGALQPHFAEAYSLDLTQSGLVASAFMLGILAGSLAAAPLVDRVPRRPLFVAAVGVCALALLGAGVAPSYALLLSASLLFGAAAGAYETLLNAAVPESQPDRAAPRLALAHAAATVGAILGAPALARLAAAWGSVGALCALAAAFALLAAIGAAASFPAPPAGPGRAPFAASLAALPLRALLPLAIASAAYVGVEASLGVILPPLAAARGLAETSGANAISGFWAGVFLARIAFERLSLPARPRELVIGGGAAALTLAAGALLELGPLALWSGVVGFALGAVFPVLVVLAGDAAPAQRATALALVVAAGSIGGGVLPWIVGEAGLALAPFVLAAGCTLIALGAALVRRRP
jgi:fucose permease